METDSASTSVSRKAQKNTNKAKNHDQTDEHADPVLANSPDGEAAIQEGELPSNHDQDGKDDDNNTSTDSVICIDTFEKEPNFQTGGNVASEVATPVTILRKSANDIEPPPNRLTSEECQNAKQSDSALCSLSNENDVEMEDTTKPYLLTSQEKMVTSNTQNNSAQTHPTEPEEAVQATTRQASTGCSENEQNGVIGECPPKDDLHKYLMETRTACKDAEAKCSNPDCSSTCNDIFVAPLFTVNFYDIPKKKKMLYICNDCFESVVQQYTNFGSLLVNRQPLYEVDIPRANELVEISDSSDEESNIAADNVDTPLPAHIISMVAEELEETFARVFKKYDMGQQIAGSMVKLKEHLCRIEVSGSQFNEEMKEMGVKLDVLQHNLYDSAKHTTKELPPIDISEDYSSGTTTNNPNMHLYRNSGVLVRPPVQLNEVYFGIRGGSLLGSWYECKVVDEVSQMPSKYMVQFLQGPRLCVFLDRKRLAYSTPPNVRLQQGMRVIAKIDITANSHPKVESQSSSGDSFYAGIVAETLNTYNAQRYLIIFDNGYTLYAMPWNVRVVCEQSMFVWEDVDNHSKEFVRDYLNNYKSVRPMVQVKKGQRLLTERDAKWHLANVLKIDSSLVLLQFPDTKRREWIFRGSKRLAPLYHDRKYDRQQISKFQKRNIPSIEYITIDDDDDENTADDGHNGDALPGTSRTAIATSQTGSTIEAPSPPDSKDALAYLQNPQSRIVAKKGMPGRTNATLPPTQIVMNKNIIYCDNDRPQGRTNMYTTKNYRGPDRYIPHQCSPACIFEITFDLKTYNLLARPLISGWERQICRTRGKRASVVVYRAPCGRRLRYMYELHRYLRITRAPLNVEHFDFDPEIRALAHYKAESLIYETRDLSCGKELMPVSCVNYFDDTQPPPCQYSTERIPTEGVNINLDDDFLCGCDCEDDCFDKSKCQCWQLTVQGALYNKPNTPIDDIGYVYKRLEELVLTGIYECNSRCKCKVKECLNRVVQHPLQTKLQVYKTSNRGWGIRCLNDVPKGSFICIYTGHLLTEEASNLICAQNEDKAGDEYFADLDYIETVQQFKDGYESEAVWDKEDESGDESDNEPENETLNSMPDSDDEFTSKSKPSGRVVNTRAKLKQSKTQGEERERVNLIPNTVMDTADTSDATNRHLTFRQLFGENEQIYVMDAKKSGNLGRYFNHSCVPNLVVQNVFVDTHDLRFPWVAFFASRNIQAGSELTWNYNYDVGSVPGKVLFCNCGEANCRKRLL